MRSRLRSYARFYARIPGFLNQTLSEEDARSLIQRRLVDREARFLGLLRRAVFDRPRSPYLPLLRAAGCDYADLEAELPRHGIVEVLGRLRDAGVRVSLDEFKGRASIERAGVVVQPTAQDFDAPLTEAGIEISTGGTTGGATRMRFDLDFLAERACYEHVVFRMLDLYGVPLALWYPELPATTGIGSLLRYGRIGHPPARWFSMAVGGKSFWSGSALATRLALARSWGSAAPLAWPQRLANEEASVVVDWTSSTRARHGRCAVQCYASTAVRICQSARERGTDLTGTQFIVGSEPLSPAKRREIAATGATVYSRYFATEPGSIALGCGDPHAPNGSSDYHLAADTIAAIPGEGADSCRPLLLTSLLESGPKVMINVDLGDVGTLGERPCGCPFSEVGLTTHIADVASAQRATAEGMALPYTDLGRIVEEVLPARYGGTSLDYQWVEEENDRGLMRLRLRVSPRLGEVDPESARELVFEQLVKLDRSNAFFVEVWRRAGIVSVARELPTRTALGKLHPVLRHRPGA